ncbi:dapper homolog 2 isoform 1-T1 [Dugong dugon]
MLAPGAPGVGWDRHRVGARLRAALAGLHELQVLRERQQARVRGALDTQPPRPRCAAGDPRGQERRLEGALAALKEQLSRLRQQDLGLKTHLDQLDQQISELQLGVCKGASELPDSDSRPSSGFYELSDAASCSRSTSCASVCSESVSSSRGSLLPGAQRPTARLGEYRPRSADETTVHMAPGPPQRPHLAEGRAEGTGGAWGRFRPRPVSTGDLERVLPTVVGPQRAGTDAWSSSPLSRGVPILPHVVDPKYQSDLVSRSGKEVYPYPSPLHAVALQSPLFTLTEETPQTGSSKPPRNPSPGSVGVSSIRTRPIPKAHPAGAYINKLLQRTQGWGRPLRGGVGERATPRCGASSAQQACSGQNVAREGRLEKLVCSLDSKEVEGVTQMGSTHGGSPTQPGSVSLVDTQQPAGLPEDSVPSENCTLGKTAWGPPLLEQEQDAPTCPQAGPPHPASHYWDDKADLPCGKGGTKSPSVLWGQLVHTPFAATPESYPTQLKTGSPRVKATKVKQRMSNRALRFETSEDEGGSDHTTNRFGDGESSDSGAETGCSLVLGQGTAGPGEPRRPPPAAPELLRASSGPRPSPGPRLCHVKASRALKKKIRRFQPASLRVMTMILQATEAPSQDKPSRYRWSWLLCIITSIRALARRTSPTPAVGESRPSHTMPSKEECSYTRLCVGNDLNVNSHVALS